MDYNTLKLNERIIDLENELKELKYKMVEYEKIIIEKDYKIDYLKNNISKLQDYAEEAYYKLNYNISLFTHKRIEYKNRINSLTQQLEALLQQNL